MLTLAESLAANPAVRLKPVDQAGSPLPATVASCRRPPASTWRPSPTSGRHRREHRSAAGPYDPALARVLAEPERAWSGTVSIGGSEVLAAAVPILSNPDQTTSRPVSWASRSPPNPISSRWSSLVTAAPTLLTYLGAAMLLGVVGSLLLARWIKRRRSGMEPADIAALAEQREAIFSGIAEGVIALDTRNQITFVNPLARDPAVLARRLGRPDPG